MNADYTKKEDGYYDEYGNWFSRTLIEDPDNYKLSYEDY
jgi:hypothetical protein